MFSCSDIVRFPSFAHPMFRPRRGSAGLGSRPSSALEPVSPFACRIECKPSHSGSKGIQQDWSSELQDWSSELPSGGGTFSPSDRPATQAQDDGPTHVRGAVAQPPSQLVCPRRLRNTLQHLRNFPHLACERVEARELRSRRFMFV